MKNLLTAALCAVLFTGCIKEPIVETPPDEEVSPERFDQLSVYAPVDNGATLRQYDLELATDIEAESDDTSAIFINLNCGDCLNYDFYIIQDDDYYDSNAIPVAVGMQVNSVTETFRVSGADYRIFVTPNQSKDVLYRSARIVIADNKYHTFLYQGNGNGYDGHLRYYSYDTGNTETLFTHKDNNQRENKDI